MRALLDTCVVMDFLQNREPFSLAAKSIFRAAATDWFNGSITAKSATDIYYLTHRCTHSDKESREKLNQLLKQKRRANKIGSAFLFYSFSNTRNRNEMVVVSSGRAARRAAPSRGVFQ